MNRIDLATALSRNSSHTARTPVNTAAVVAEPSLSAPQPMNTAALLGRVGPALTAPRAARPGAHCRTVSTRTPLYAAKKRAARAETSKVAFPMTDTAKWATKVVNTESDDARHTAAAALLCVAPDVLSAEQVESLAAQLREVKPLVEKTGDLSAAAEAVLEKAWTELYLAQ